MRQLIILLAFGLFGSILLSLTISEQQKPWVIPDKYKSMKNPVAVSDDVLDLGKTLYNQHCKSCHGKDGLGDGPKAAQLETSAGDFTDPAFKKQADGILLFKSWIGRDEMPNFEKKIPDVEEIWAVIHYMKTFE